MKTASRRHLHSVRTGLLALAAIAALPSTALACASCGCSLNADWGAQGLSTQAGWSADLRIDYLNQDQLRYGTGSISPTAAAAITNTDTGEPAEVEQYTRNVYTTFTLDYSSAQPWGITLTVPYIQRSHSTLGVGGDGVSPGDAAYVSNTHDLGDVKLVGRYYGFADEKNWGVQLGFKLPTGSHTKTGTLTDPAGPPGGVATIDPGLQPGSGTTDVIAGIFGFDNLNADWSWFAQGTYQHALSTVDGYRTGDSVSLAAGLRYYGWQSVTPQLQLNVRHAHHDGGEAADTWATGGTLVYLTPGISVPVTERVSAYSYVQVPLWQDLRGVQLAPRVIVSAGVHMTF
ncbi:MAG: TonB-dependent receptor [Proteobacteria bacterium]|nr:TonB-dependent receptor [Pseudomonadota bacterium]